MSKIKIDLDEVVSTREKCLGAVRWRVTEDEKIVLEQEWLVQGHARAGGALVPVSERREWRSVPVVAAPEFWAAREASGDAVRFEFEPTAGFITILRGKT